jgi:rhodanese-related sulfurtransferase
MPTEVDRNAVRRLVDEGAQLVEVLPRDEYEDEHLPGAISLSIKELDRLTVTQLARDRPVVVYCNDYQ